jgi:RNA polymerase sigma-70 factor (ECF subfamily)
MSATTEARWLARLREGRKAEREAACREIYQALRGRVFRVCLQMCGERTLAEDAMQNAFLAVFRGLHTFRGDAQLSTWVYRVAIREALALRMRRPPQTESVEAAGSIATDDPPVDAQVAARQRARATQSAFATLSADHRAVLSLFAVEGLRHRQIAEVLGVPEGTVWYRLHAARKALQAKLGGGDAGAR